MVVARIDKYTVARYRVWTVPAVLSNKLTVTPVAIKCQKYREIDNGREDIKNKKNLTGPVRALNNFN